MINKYKTKFIMINENDPANPVGAWGQQSTTGETILMKYAAMFMAGLLNNPEPYEAEALSNHAIYLAKTLIAELNKEMELSIPIMLRN